MDLLAIDKMKESFLIEKHHLMAFSIDCVLFGYNDESIKVLTLASDMPQFEGKWSLIGDLVRIDEDLDQTIDRLLKYYTGMDNLYLEQVGTFGAPNRHPLGRVVTTAYYALIRLNDFRPPKTNQTHPMQWMEIDPIPELAFDHSDILRESFHQLKRRLRERPIGFNLLPRQFTLSELQNLYEVVLGDELDKRNFRRKLIQSGLLIDTGQTQKAVSHRPAKLYSFDFQAYEKRLDKIVF